MYTRNANHASSYTACIPSSETEKNRRRDLVTTLRARREQLQQSLKRSDAGTTRSQLFGTSNGAGGAAARETDATAGLDTKGLLQLQRDVMEDQDQQLEELEKTVTSTRVRCCVHCQHGHDDPT